MVGTQAIRRVVREVAALRNNPPEGIRVVTSEENMLDITGIIAGPTGTPYEGGYFRVEFQFGDEFPAAPPKCRFVTRIFHPNVSKAGEICVNTLKKDWKSSFGIEHILVTVKCLLIYPNGESALDEEAGKLILERYEDFARQAKLMTSIHAMPKRPPPEFMDTTKQESEKAFEIEPLIPLAPSAQVPVNAPQLDYVPPPSPAPSQAFSPVPQAAFSPIPDGYNSPTPRGSPDRPALASYPQHRSKPLVDRLRSNSPMGLIEQKRLARLALAEKMDRDKRWGGPKRRGLRRL